MARFLTTGIVGLLLIGSAPCARAQFWRRAAEPEPASPPVAEEPTLIGPAPSETPLPEPNTAPTQVVAPATPAPGRGELTEKRAMYRLRDQETVDALVRLAAGRQLREQELVVVSRLIREKEMELASFDERLQKQFGVSPTGNYHYDNERRIIFSLRGREDLDPETFDPSDPLAAFEKNPMRRLKDEEAEQLFLRLVGAKKITTDQIRSL